MPRAAIDITGPDQRLRAVHLYLGPASARVGIDSQGLIMGGPGGVQIAGSGQHPRSGEPHPPLRLTPLRIHRTDVTVRKRFPSTLRVSWPASVRDHIIFRAVGATAHG